jgi:hypothetical protein
MVGSTTLAGVAERIVRGEDLLLATRDFLDQVPRRTSEQLAEFVRQRPDLTGNDCADALLARIAEHLAVTLGIPCPVRVGEPERFLDRFWFVSEVAGLRAAALAQAPVAHKRRGVLWPARSLERV